MKREQASVGAVREVVKRVRRLTTRSNRDSAGCYWIEGIRHFIQAYDAGQTFEVCIYSPILLKSDLAEMLTRRLASRGVPKVKVSPEIFRELSRSRRASGIGAIVRQRWLPLASLVPDHEHFVLVIEEIRSPGNLGTILRSAEATGASGIVFVGDKSDPFAAEVVRASMGGVFHLPLARGSHDEVKQWANERNVALVGLSPESERLWTELPTGQPIGLVIGEERRGLTEGLRSLCNVMVRLPMTGKADSLNVGVAAGVAMFEVVRRRGGFGLREGVGCSD